MQEIANDNQHADQGSIRLFFIDERTGNPVAGVVVSLFVDSPRNQEQHLATLQTDQAGYVSFKFDLSIVTANSQLKVTHSASRGDELVFKVADLLAGNDTHRIRFDASDSTLSNLGL